MSDEDHEIDVETDDDDDDDDSKANRSEYTSEQDVPLSQTDKRAHHNALERKRRDHIKDSFSSLRDCVPNLQDSKASRAMILKRATEYIASMKARNAKHQLDIDQIRQQNRMLEEQVAALEQIKKTNEFVDANSDSDSEPKTRRKKLKSC